MCNKCLYFPRTIIITIINSKNNTSNRKRSLNIRLRKRQTFWGSLTKIRVRRSWVVFPIQLHDDETNQDKNNHQKHPANEGTCVESTPASFGLLSRWVRVRVPGCCWYSRRARYHSRLCYGRKHSRIEHYGGIGHYSGVGHYGGVGRNISCTGWRDHRY